jgi:hypothetical protein
MLVVLTILIILEFTKYGELYHDYIIILDYIIVTFFVVDLCFKWNHVRNIKTFVKLYWIDIIAVFPFYLIFRTFYLVREIVILSEEAPKYLHELVLLRETKFLRELEMAKLLHEAEYARLLREAKFVRVAARFLRVIRARWYLAYFGLRRAQSKLNASR